MYKSTGEVMCYASCGSGDPSDICKVFGDEYTFEEISKGEFERETEGEE